MNEMKLEYLSLKFQMIKKNLSLLSSSPTFARGFSNVQFPRRFGLGQPGTSESLPPPRRPSSRSIIFCTVSSILMLFYYLAHSQLTVLWRHDACSSLLGTRERFTCWTRVRRREGKPYETVEWIQMPILIQSQYATASDFTECEWGKQRSALALGGV